MAPAIFPDIPMTPLESILKQCLDLRPDIRSHIPTADELTDYIAWMGQQFGQDHPFRVQQLPVPPCSPEFSDIAQILLDDPQNRSAFARLASGYGSHSEDFFISSDKDISVSRQLRYLPSHWHSNKYFELYYLVSGSCPVYFPEEIIELKAGSILLVAPNAIHASPCFQDDCNLLFYMVRSSTFQQVFWNQLPSDSLMSGFFQQILDGKNPTAYLHFETGTDPDIQRILFQIYEEEAGSEIYQRQMLNTLMSTFFILLLRRYESSVRLPRTKDFFWKHEYSAILSYIQAHYDTVSLQELSDRFHYSPRQISRIVQTNMGFSYNHLIQKLRMEKAAVLLNQNTLSISAIAQKVGYSTSSSFYRAFTDYFHCTPKEFLANSHMDRL